MSEFQSKPIFNVNRGVSVTMNNDMGHDLVDLLFDIEKLPAHLFALAEQVNYKLPSQFQVKHPQEDAAEPKKEAS